MSDHPTAERLADYAYGFLAEVEARSVEGHLRECDGCAVLAGRLEAERARLAEALPTPPPAGLQERILAAASPDKLSERRAGGFASRSARRGLEARLPVAAAAALFFGVLGVLLFRPGNSPEPAPRVVSGQVEVEGRGAVVLAPGSPFLVVGSGPARIQLRGESLAEFSPGSAAVFQGLQPGAGAALELRQGAGQFRVGRGVGPFRVTTSIGLVTAQGAEFSVELRQADRKGEPKMASLLSLVVAVMAGNVQVEAGGRTAMVSPGEKAVCMDGGVLEIAAQEKDDGEQGQKGKNEKGKKNDKDDKEDGEKGKKEEGKKNDKDDDGSKEKGKKKEKKGDD